MSSEREQGLCQRITDYLANGGLFNPEMSEHDKVRTLLIDCRMILLELSDKLHKQAFGSAYQRGFEEAKEPLRELIVKWRMAQANITNNYHYGMCADELEEAIRALEMS